MLELESVVRLNKDLIAASRTLSDDEARFLVGAYYTMQEDRIRAAAQKREADKSGEPNQVLGWLFDQHSTLEKQIHRALTKYTDEHPMGQWMKSIVGVGPVISAGMLAHIDIKQAPTAGHIWRFAGQDPTSEWKKGQRRPWNAELKRLCWLLGESFVKTSNHADDVYGKYYKSRKEQETRRNEAGEYADQAAKILVTKNIDKKTEAYKHYAKGVLPPGHIHARAKRYAVKLFLAHLQQVWWEKATGEKAPKPYALAILGHAHMINPPEAA